MAENTKIEWADHTFNPWEGCTKVSPGCANCYAEARNHRYGLDNWGKGKPRRRTSEANWRKPLKWEKLAKSAFGSWDTFRDTLGTTDQKLIENGHVPFRRPRVFCASLADWLDDEVPIEWLADLFKLIHDTPNLDWLLLTKRPENAFRRMAEANTARRVGLIDRAKGNGEFAKAAAWLEFWRTGAEAPSNVWMGTTVENQEQEERVSHLLKIPAKVRFLSCEPLLGAVDLVLRGLPGWDEDWKLDALTGAEWASARDDSAPPANAPRIHWVICGGESGPNARPMHPSWARGLRDQCRAASVPFFFKQWGEHRLAVNAGVWLYLDAEYERQIREKEIITFGEPKFIRVGKKAAGRLLDGREWNEFPVVGGGK